jgi:hypothetical protein
MARTVEELTRFLEAQNVAVDEDGLEDELTDRGWEIDYDRETTGGHVIQVRFLGEKDRIIEGLSDPGHPDPDEHRSVALMRALEEVIYQEKGAN